MNVNVAIGRLGWMGKDGSNGLPDGWQRGVVDGNIACIKDRGGMRVEIKAEEPRFEAPETTIR